MEGGRKGFENSKLLRNRMPLLALLLLAALKSQKGRNKISSSAANVFTLIYLFIFDVSN